MECINTKTKLYLFEKIDTPCIFTIQGVLYKINFPQIIPETPIVIVKKYIFFKLLCGRNKDLINELIFNKKNNPIFSCSYNY